MPPPPRYNYAEILVPVFSQMLQKLKMIHGHLQLSGGEFWDVGCGLAKPVFVAALMHNFSLCGGVDAIGAVVDGAKKIQEVSWTGHLDELNGLEDKAQNQRETRT